MSGQDGPEATWDRVAGAWDSYVDYVNSHAADATAVLIDAVGVRPGDRLVELAGGPGTLGQRWSELVGPEGDVIVSDLAPSMVDAAARRLAPFPNVRTARLDMSAIDLADGSADVAVCRFGLMFVPEPERALAELHRILSPGGRLGTMTWAGPEHNAWVTTVGMAAMATGITTGGPPIGPGELFSLSDPDRLVTLATEAGFDGVGVTDAEVTFTAPTVDAHVDMVEQLAAPLSAAFAGATPDQIAAVRQMVADGAAPFAAGDGYEFPGRALVLTATRP